MENKNLYNKNVGSKYNDNLDEYKKNVTDWFDYFRDNIDRFNRQYKSIRFNSLAADKLDVITKLGRPPIQFEEREAYINRQLGEISSHEPTYTVSAKSNVGTFNMDQSYQDTIEVMQGYISYLMSDEHVGKLQFDIFADMLIGGFSVGMVETNYKDDWSFDDEQEIFIKKAFLPTKCFFDITAIEKCKEDGMFCGEVYCYTIDEAKRLYGEDIGEQMSFADPTGDLMWSYTNYNKRMISIVKYYAKEIKKTKIVKISNGSRMTKKEYDRKLLQWEEEGHLSLPPIIIQERMTSLTTIKCIHFCGNKILKTEDTDYDILPLVFFDGNSAMLCDGIGSNMGQVTIDYTHHLEGVQDLKNISGQALAFEMENMINLKFMADRNVIDPEYLNSWLKPQLMSTLIYNSHPENSDQELPIPQVIPRPQVPQVFQQMFADSSRTMQSILGSYDAIMGINAGDTSGKAIQQGAIQSSAGVAPYKQGLLTGLNQIAKIVLNLAPKYHKTPRTIPIIKPDGKKGYQVINDEKDPNSIFMNYNPRDFNITIKAGINVNVAKQMAVDQLIRGAQAIPGVAQFLSQYGVEIFVGNLDMQDSEVLKQRAVKFEQQQQMMAQKAMQQPKIDPMALKQQEIQLKAQQLQQEGVLESAKIQVENKEADIKAMEAATKMQATKQDAFVKMQQAQSENVRSAAILGKELAQHHHEIKESQRDRIERSLVHKDKMRLEQHKINKSFQSKKEKSNDSIG